MLESGAVSRKSSGRCSPCAANKRNYRRKIKPDEEVEGMRHPASNSVRVPRLVWRVRLPLRLAADLPFGPSLISIKPKPYIISCQHNYLIRFDWLPLEGSTTVFPQTLKGRAPSSKPRRRWIQVFQLRGDEIGEGGRHGNRHRKNFLFGQRGLGCHRALSNCLQLDGSAQTELNGLEARGS